MSLNLYFFCYFFLLNYLWQFFGLLWAWLAVVDGVDHQRSLVDGG